MILYRLLFVLLSIINAYALGVHVAAGSWGWAAFAVLMVLFCASQILPERGEES